MVDLAVRTGLIVTPLQPRQASAPKWVHLLRAGLLVLSTVMVLVTAGVLPRAGADNSRLNKSVVSNVYTVQRRAGCTNQLNISPPLQLAAEWHTNDVLNNRNLDGDIGSDGSTVQDRARAAGFTGEVDETLAINPALAISGIELINMWFYDARAHATMSDCGNTAIGVWSANSLDRTVVVAVYGKA